MKGGPKVNNSRQLANDLRRTHFTLGTGASHHQSSEYVAEYQRKQTAFETSQKDKLNLRASHFEFGPHDPSKTFVTLHQKDFKEHVGFQPPRLNEEKKRDLRSSHFVLGNYHAPYASLNHANFTEKYIPIGQQRQEQEEQKNKMRKHNHDFTETNKKHLTSEYHAHFNKQNDPNSLKQGLSPAELRQKVIDLRKSHVVLGGDHKPMQSIAQQDYQFRPGTILPAANDNVNIRRTNFKLGTEQGDMASLYHSEFVKHPKSKPESLGALGQDLRATHFSLGQEAPLYATTSGNHRGPPVGFKPPQTLNPNLQKNHFTIGDNSAPLLNKTTYTNNYRNFGNAAQTQARDQTQDRGSNFNFGGQRAPWVTETQQNYINHEGAKPADLEGFLKADLRSSHFKFNDVKPDSQFKTTQQTSYVPKEGVPNKLDEALKKDLQANHFKLGQTHSGYGTTSGAAYQPTDGKPSNLDPSLAKDLRANHFTHGDGKWQHQSSTEYRSNYFWKTENEANQ